jgi:hypothetical protein
MIVHYLASEHRTGAVVTDADIAGWAPPGEPVVPNVPTGQPNTFLGLDTFRTVPYARVLSGDIDPDALAQHLAQQYPGLPVEFHDAYVLETLKTASKLQPGMIVQVYTDADTARIKVIDQPDIYILWQEQPIPGRYRL